MNPELQNWCTSVLGHNQILADNSRVHGGHESTTLRVKAKSGVYYLKQHHTLSYWEQEVHAYERWTPIWDNFAPKLIAVHETPPLALLISELPGHPLEHASLTPLQEQNVWYAAGELLIHLHELETGDYFGSCSRNGRCASASPQNAETAIIEQLTKQIEQAKQGNYIDANELATMQRTLQLIPAFAGEQPVPCHRDYCAANWLVDNQGTFTGVIDFEFAHWDVRAADFSRDPNWHWMHRPDLIDAFFTGYGRFPSPAEEQQLFVTRAAYALSAITWGRDNQFYGFETEGHVALKYLDKLIN